MSTARRSGRLSQVPASQEDDNMMDVDNSSDNEMIETITSPKKRQARKAPTQPSPARKRASIEDSAESSTNLDSLYAQLKNSAAISITIDSWLSDYRSAKTKHAAAQSLINLVLEASLLKDSPSVKVVASGNEEAARKFVQNIKVNASADLPEFPLSSKSPAATRFTRAYARFWQDLVTAGSENALVDDWLLPRLLLFFAAFAHSPLRPLRYASAYTAFLLCSELMKQLETATYELKQREKQRRANESRSKVATARLDAGMEEVQKRAQKYEKAILQIWAEVYEADGWKDRDPAIRTLAAKYIGAWCIKLPRIFMDPNHFRYLTFLMADGQAEVRLAAAESLHKLLETEPLRPTLENHCTHLVDRILSFTRDSNEKVAVLGVQIARLLRQHFGRDYLSEEVVREISLLISIESPALRHAAGAFALPDIFAIAEGHATGEAEEDGDQEEGTKKGKKKKTPAKKSAAAAKSGATQLKGAAATRMLALLDFIPDLTVHQELPEVVIDAIWQQDPDYFLFQFEDIGKMLAATDASQLSDEKLVLLAEVILAVVHKLEDSITTKTPKGFSPSQLLKSFTQVFHTILPELLSSHKAEDGLLPPLISLTNFLDTTYIASIKADGTRNSIAKLAQNLKAVLTSTTNEHVMAKVVSAFDHLLADTTFKYHRDVDRILRSMVDEMVESLRGFVDGFDDPGSSQVARPKRRESTPGSAAFVDGAASGSAPLVLCLTRLFSLTRYFDLHRLDDSIVDLALKVMETRADALYYVVGPRSAHFASQIAARLLVYRMNEFATEASSEESKVVDEDEQYDVKPGEDADADENSDDEMLESQATRRSRHSQKKKKATMDLDADNSDDLTATPSRKKGKKSNATGPKLYGAIALLRVPDASEIANLSRKVHRTIDLCQKLLSRADDSDLDDLASYGAMLSLGHLLSTYSPSLSSTVLKDLAYECPHDLEEAMWTAFEAEMERTPLEDDSLDVESRLLLVLNFFYRLTAIGVFHRSPEVDCARRCVAQLKSPHGLVSRSARQILNELRASTFQSAVKYGGLISETLKYVYDSAADDVQRHQEVASVAKQLAKSFPPGNSTIGTEACKIVLDTLVKHVLGAFDDEQWQLLAWSCAPFVSKLSPAASRKLLEDWNASSHHQSIDRRVADAETGVKETYGELKNLLKHRASGRRAAKAVADGADDLNASMADSVTSTSKRTPKKSATSAAGAKSTPKRKAANDDEDEEFGTPAKGGKQTPNKKTPKKTATTSTEPPARRSSRATAAAIIHQGAGNDAASVTEDSEMAHTEDEASEAGEEVSRRPSRAVTPSRATMTSTAKMTMNVDESSEADAETPAKTTGARGGRKTSSQKSQASQGSSGQVGDSEDEDDEMMHTQASEEINMDELLEPPTTRPKRQRSAPIADPESSEASDSSESLMKHTPTPKKRSARK